jgi:hypothetical protein
MGEDGCCKERTKEVLMRKIRRDIPEEDDEDKVSKDRKKLEEETERELRNKESD